MRGKESVLLFLRDLYRIVTPEMRLLKRFEKIELNSGEQQVVTFTLSAEDLSFYGVDNRKQLEDGDFLVEISNLTGKFTLIFAEQWSAC